MDLELRPCDVELQGRAAELARSVFLPAAEQLDRTGAIEPATLDGIRASGLLRAFLPEARGGQGADLVSLALVLEELGAASPALAMLAATQVVVGNRMLLAYAEHPDRDAIAAAAADAHGLVTLAAAEVSAGCDLTAIGSKVRVGSDGGLTLDGAKRYVNWAGRAAWIAILAAQEGGGPTMVLVPGRTQGLTASAPLATMGLAGLEAASLELTGVKVPGHHLVGALGYGVDIYEKTLAEMRVAIAAIATGLARAAFDLAVTHGKTRKQAGVPVGSNQGLQWRFADVATAIDGSRLHGLQAAWKSSLRRPFVTESAMAKVFATETAGRVTDFAVQVLGGEGVVRGAAVERLFRDARFFQICSGTSEVLRSAIARDL